MSHFERNKDFFDRPYLLTKDQQSKPLTVISGFFDDYRLCQARESLTGFLNCALTSNRDFAEASDRATAIEFCNRMEELLEATFLLARKTG